MKRRGGGQMSRGETRSSYKWGTDHWGVDTWIGSTDGRESTRLFWFSLQITEFLRCYIHHTHRHSVPERNRHLLNCEPMPTTSITTTVFSLRQTGYPPHSNRMWIFQHINGLSLISGWVRVSFLWCNWHWLHKAPAASADPCPLQLLTTMWRTMTHLYSSSFGNSSESGCGIRRVTRCAKCDTHSAKEGPHFLKTRPQTIFKTIKRRPSCVFSALEPITICCYKCNWPPSVLHLGGGLTPLTIQFIHLLRQALRQSQLRTLHSSWRKKYGREDAASGYFGSGMSFLSLLAEATPSVVVCMLHLAAAAFRYGGRQWL
jgi:hypothetical protein